MKKFLELSGNFRSWTSLLKTPSHVLYIRSPWTCICPCNCICIHTLAFSSLFVCFEVCVVLEFHLMSCTLGVPGVTRRGRSPRKDNEVKHELVNLISPVYAISINLKNSQKISPHFDVSNLSFFPLQIKYFLYSTCSDPLVED